MMTMILGRTKGTRDKDLIKRRSGKLKCDRAYAPGSAVKIERNADKKACAAVNFSVLKRPGAIGPTGAPDVEPKDFTALTVKPAKGKKKNAQNTTAIRMSTVTLRLRPEIIFMAYALSLPTLRAIH